MLWNYCSILQSSPTAVQRKYSNVYILHAHLSALFDIWMWCQSTEILHRISQRNVHDFRIEFNEIQYVISVLWDANIANTFILLLWLPAYKLQGSEKKRKLKCDVGWTLQTRSFPAKRCPSAPLPLYSFRRCVLFAWIYPTAHHSVTTAPQFLTVTRKDPKSIPKVEYCETSRYCHSFPNSIRNC